MSTTHTHTHTHTMQRAVTLRVISAGELRVRPLQLLHHSCCTSRHSMRLSPARSCPPLSADRWRVVSYFKRAVPYKESEAFTMPPKVPAGAAAAAAAEDDDHESSSSEDEKGEAGKENKQSKLERKSRKAVAKLGLKPITGVTRVTLRRQKSYQVRVLCVRPSRALSSPSPPAAPTIALTHSRSSSSLRPTFLNPPSATPM